MPYYVFYCICFLVFPNQCNKRAPAKKNIKIIHELNWKLTKKSLIIHSLRNKWNEKCSKGPRDLWKLRRAVWRALHATVRARMRAARPRPSERLGACCSRRRGPQTQDEKAEWKPHFSKLLPDDNCNEPAARLNGRVQLDLHHHHHPFN